MDDLSGALALVAFIDLAVLAAGSCVLVAWFHSSRPSAAALGGAWAGFLGGYVAFLGWALVPKDQIFGTILFAVVLGVVIGAGVWLTFWLAERLLEHRPRD